MMDLIILVCVLVAQLCLTLCDPWTVAHQAPLSMGFPRQEYCSGLSFPTPGDLADQRFKSISPALAGRFFTTEPPGKPVCIVKPPTGLIRCAQPAL